MIGTNNSGSELTVILGAEMALRAVFRHDVSKASGHDGAGEACRTTPE